MTSNPMVLGSLVLPWPPRGLNPNGRVHWADASRLKKAQKKAAWQAGLTRGLHLHKGRIPAEAIIALHWTFCPPPRAAHSYDDDNAEAAMKAARDQIAAMIGVDDRRFRATRERGPAVKGGRVVATLAAVVSDGTWAPSSYSDLHRQIVGEVAE